MKKIRPIGLNCYKNFAQRKNCQNIYIKPSFETAYVGKKLKNWRISKVAQKFAKSLDEFFLKKFAKGLKKGTIGEILPNLVTLHDDYSC